MPRRFSLSTWFALRLQRDALRQTLRTTLAAAASLLAARLCVLPEAHWAVISTIIVTQSSRGAAWSVSCQRFLGTLLGGLTAVALASFLAPGLLPLVAGLLALGFLCALLPEQTSAYRFAGITLAVVLLATQTAPIWSIALHRFLEVSVGILVGMTAMTLWPDPPSSDRHPSQPP